ncbi:hypothetical protein K488DRAFT_47820, partial [Vararia minispora EC-137]
MALPLYSFALLLLTTIPFSAAVSIAFPLEDQLPTIARIGQPYSWAFSPETFDDDGTGTLTYAAYSLQDWMTFDPASRTISGTPAAEDEGNPRVRIEAQDVHGAVASSVLTLCVTPYGPPVLKKPLSDQFMPNNPSLSSVFVVAPNSALGVRQGIPALRVPSQWSFSIGFQGDTFAGKKGLFYDARKGDGGPLPAWMRFNPQDITLDGVTPHAEDLPTPAVFDLALHASDQVGYSAASLPFAVVVASHELTLGPAGLPTVNVTAGEHFDVPLLSPADFHGVLVDGEQVVPSDIVGLTVDATNATGVAYDATSRRLSGDAPASSLELPVVLATTFNQSLHTSIRLVSVPSVFTQAAFSTILAKGSDHVKFGLLPFLTDAGTSDDVAISVSFSPAEAGSWLSFDNQTCVLSGIVPTDDPGYEHVVATFTAYSNGTHSTSHAQLPLSLTQNDFKHSAHGGAPGVDAPGVRVARGKVVTILSIVFGVFGALLGIGLLIAALTKCARVKDSALSMEEAAKSYSESEKRYYGVGVDPEQGYGFADQQPGKAYGGLGLGLHRNLTRAPSNPISSSITSSTGQMSKAQWMDKIRSGMRTVSDIARKGSLAKRPVIGRPMLVAPPGEGSLAQTTPSLVPISGVMQPGLFTSKAPRDSLGDSFYHIRQRAEFGGQPGATARVRGSRGHARASSDDSLDSLASDASERTHEAHAVVQHASRTSLRRYRVPLSDSKARMVPFTSASRAAVPRSPT